MTFLRPSTDVALLAAVDGKANIKRA